MLKGFSKGGIHTPEYKISKAEAIADFPLPEIAVPHPPGVRSPVSAPAIHERITPSELLLTVE